MKLELTPLPYATDALEPHISARTLELHYGKHHQGYMDKLRKAVEGTPNADQVLEHLIRTAEGDLFNNAAQVWNHAFYWQSLHPKGGGKPGRDVQEALERSFGSFEAFRKQFAAAATGEFGSGWAWLVMDPEAKLSVRSSSDAENPLQRGLTPLLTLDVWEHAYYLDYQNERGRYVESFLDELVNWDFVNENLTQGPREFGGPTRGEGNPEADRRYRRAARDFAESDRLAPAARRAARDVESPS